jgi:hypothetical protein
MKTTFFALAAAVALTAAVPAFAKGGHVGTVNSLPKSFYSNTYTRPSTFAESGDADKQTMDAKHPQYGAIRKDDDESTQ